MSTSPVSPEDIRASAAAHQELGPEYSDAVVAAFLERVDRAIDARVAARLAAMGHGPAAAPARQPGPGRGTGRRPLVKGLVIGACGGALATALAFTALDGGAPPAASGQTIHVQLLPARVFNGGMEIPPPVPPPNGG